MAKSLRVGGTGDSPAMGRSGCRRKQSQLKRNKMLRQDQDKGRGWVTQRIKGDVSRFK